MIKNLINQELITLNFVKIGPMNTDNPELFFNQLFFLVMSFHCYCNAGMVLISSVASIRAIVWFPLFFSVLVAVRRHSQNGKY